jgi:hypothetical protein
MSNSLQSIYMHDTDVRSKDTTIQTIVLPTPDAGKDGFVAYKRSHRTQTMQTSLS